MTFQQQHRAGLGYGAIHPADPDGRARGRRRVRVGQGQMPAAFIAGMPTTSPNSAKACDVSGSATMQRARRAASVFMRGRYPSVRANAPHGAQVRRHGRARPFGVAGLQRLHDGQMLGPRLHRALRQALDVAQRARRRASAIIAAMDLLPQ